MFDESVFRTLARDSERSRLREATMASRAHRAVPMFDVPATIAAVFAAPRQPVMLMLAGRCGALMGLVLRAPLAATGGR